MQKPYRLGSLLLQKRLISQPQLDAALIHQRQAGIPLGEALVELNILSDRQIKRALNKQRGIRLYAAIAALFMAPFNVCQANDKQIDHLPEYSYTQVADLPSLRHHVDDYQEFAHEGYGQSLDLVELTTAAAWYMYQGGLADNQLNHVPVTMSLSTDQNSSYKLHMSISF